ncbi:MAG: 16S rRNA (adenine(1518)-N(6)/adenine(1519)-N(6))-dimethyltransferase RsmA [Gammaproteobacteria bacterium]|nr:16S rRNA (adenine(1518)-N(6)/adenine(1519)-N(6))-dimethyltransferase RsmA [Gammaproteobacteria bacterium]MCP5425796.1 16S rRNA (adenine(1518)-N(6)/adenine(1519)-N(6))-dimethyltransferase RsmA [Gammaproteobacteria bacterium]MCP5458593.1 16S rRNA (adenine(1518)-N(6)/adenine(1519)-N(6))-dimethyltransferase RsmA [Gammaproteobacteria bacterium]
MGTVAAPFAWRSLRGNSSVSLAEAALPHSRKRFGQHFLHDPGVIQRILQAIQPKPEQTLVEIGPGPGAITRPLLEAAGQLVAVELDYNLIPLLRDYCQGAGDLRIFQADALTFDFSALRQDTRRLRVVGNLPYNISTPLLFHLLQQLDAVQDMHFMLQKEVVERLAAGPGKSAYGRLSVMIQYRCEVQPLFAIGRGAFSPPPRVESAFVRLLPHRHPPVAVTDESRFTELVRRAFGQRRKTLRNTLRGLLPESAIAGLGIDPRTRPENLSLAEFAALSNCHYERL